MRRVLSSLASVPGKRVAVGGGLLVAGVAAYLFRPRSQRGATQVQDVCTGPDGYVLVTTHWGTFLVPASLSPYFTDCADRGVLAHYAIGHKKIDGVRVGTAG